MQSIEMDFLLWHPAKRYDSRRETVHRGSRVRCQPQGAFNIGIGDVHQHGLCHVVEVVTQGYDVRSNTFC